MCLKNGVCTWSWMCKWGKNYGSGHSDQATQHSNSQLAIGAIYIHDRDESEGASGRFVEREVAETWGKEKRYNTGRRMVTISQELPPTSIMEKFSNIEPRYGIVLMLAVVTGLIDPCLRELSVPAVSRCLCCNAYLISSISSFSDIAYYTFKEFNN